MELCQAALLWGKVWGRKWWLGKKHWLMTEMGTPEKATAPAPIPASMHGRLDFPPVARQSRLSAGLDIPAAEGAPVAAEMFTTEISVPRQGPKLGAPT